MEQAVKSDRRTVSYAEYIVIMKLAKDQYDNRSSAINRDLEGDGLQLKSDHETRKAQSRYRRNKTERQLSRIKLEEEVRREREKEGLGIRNFEIENESNQMLLSPQSTRDGSSYVNVTKVNIKKEELDLQSPNIHLNTDIKRNSFLKAANQLSANSKPTPVT